MQTFQFKYLFSSIALLSASLSALAGCGDSSPEDAESAASPLASAPALGRSSEGTGTDCLDPTPTVTVESTDGTSASLKILSPCAGSNPNFSLERRTGTSGAFSHVTTRPVSSVYFTDTGLAPSTQYCWRATVGTDISSVVCASTRQLAPAAPTIGFVSPNTSGGISVGFTDNSNNEDGFRVFRLMPSGQWHLEKTIPTPDKAGHQEAIQVEITPVDDYAYCFSIEAFNADNGSMSAQKCLIRL